MSGRDLRMFITSHRAEDIEKLTLRIKDGLKSNKYKPLHYEQLQPIINEKRLAFTQTLQKIEKTKQVAQRTKENTLLRQHREVWIQEQAKLVKACEKADLEVQNFMEENGVDPEFTLQMLDYEILLEKQREGFRDTTVKPIWQLREDLKYRLTEVRLHASQNTPDFQTTDQEAVLEQVKIVKDQQEAIVEKLHTECLSMEQDIFSMGIQEHLFSPGIQEDLEQLPDVILSAWCPYPDLKASLLQEFQALTEKFESKLQCIRQRLRDIGRCCGWPEEDHMMFQLVMRQYPHNLSNHRALSMDMLRRVLPHRSRQDLKDHEQFWEWYHFALAQQRALLQSWQHVRASLLMKSLLILEEAWAAHREQLAQQSERRQQQEISQQLKEKLQQWRAQQEEVARLEAAMASRRQEEEQDRLKREQEKDRARRTAQKQRIKEFYSEKQKRREEQEKKDQQRLEELRVLMAEQARKDNERVKYREELLLQHKSEKEAQTLLKLKEVAERQERLQALRNQVAVIAEVDPGRMMGDTEAWKSRHQTDEEFFLHKPLYNLFSFTDRQIVSDPRVRIEQALREAGFLNTPYARELLSAVRPVRLPRRDTESTVFKF
ncbi:hypothetical protein AGOR_G00070550 [Albula goreensis]|uniref:Coiled-coil domain-containing protein 148 n=1 Tax=Albula goreensis TaxID=1534307 RepID=A0A8T3DVH5_9TELE|nr:hypothetical protein AGOR_G00070550 [Albula goreensis]